jgi:uncharacterized membrane protein YeaQ/YmgE (transglycosylase-associated protein family)
MFLNALFIGLLGTLIADVLSLLTKKIFKIPFLDYAWVGRWFLYMKQGQFTHTNIIRSAPLSGEKSFGWFMHYAIGIVIAFIMIWLFQVGLIPLNPYLYALLFGIITVGFPFFIMQPAFGFGIAANKTPIPNIARLRSLLAHLYFGIGLSLAWYPIL